MPAHVRQLHIDLALLESLNSSRMSQHLVQTWKEITELIKSTLTTTDSIQTERNWTCIVTGSKHSSKSNLKRNFEHTRKITPSFATSIEQIRVLRFPNINAFASPPLLQHHCHITSTQSLKTFKFSIFIIKKNLLLLKQHYKIKLRKILKNL
jgi:hypothetical protein